MDLLSVKRSENKYILSQEKALQLQMQLDKVLTRDKHSGNGPYIVRSLYFDSLNNIDFSTKMAGTEVRKKIRLRIYNPSDLKCKLEAKMKVGDLQRKVSLLLDREEAQQLIKGNYSVLTKYFSKTQDAVYLYTTMQLGCYKPVAIVEYDRIAYVYPRFETRLTFDMNVRCSEVDFDLFSRDLSYTAITKHDIILEVKYDTHLLKFISKILESYNLTRLSVSKYCISRPIYYEFNE